MCDLEIGGEGKKTYDGLAVDKHTGKIIDCINQVQKIYAFNGQEYYRA